MWHDMLFPGKGFQMCGSLFFFRKAQFKTLPLHSSLYSVLVGFLESAVFNVTNVHLVAVQPWWKMCVSYFSHIRATTPVFALLCWLLVKRALNLRVMLDNLKKATKTGLKMLLIAFKVLHNLASVNWRLMAAAVLAPRLFNHLPLGISTTNSCLYLRTCLFSKTVHSHFLFFNNSYLLFDINIMQIML